MMRKYIELQNLLNYDYLLSFEIDNYQDLRAIVLEFIYELNLKIDKYSKYDVYMYFKRQIWGIENRWKYENGYGENYRSRKHFK